MTNDPICSRCHKYIAEDRFHQARLVKQGIAVCDCCTDHPRPSPSKTKTPFDEDNYCRIKEDKQ